MHKDGKKKHAGHGYKATHIKHHHDGSHTIHHQNEDPALDVEHAVNNLAGVQDSMQAHLGAPEAAAGAAALAAPAEAPPVPMGQ